MWIYVGKWQWAWRPMMRAEPRRCPHETVIVGTGLETL